MYINEKGTIAQLIHQDADGSVAYKVYGQETLHETRDHLFFSEFREASASEIPEGYGASAGAPEELEAAAKAYGALNEKIAEATGANADLLSVSVNALKVSDELKTQYVAGDALKQDLGDLIAVAQEATKALDKVTKDAAKK